MSISDKKSTTNDAQLDFNMPTPAIELPRDFRDAYLGAVRELADQLRSSRAIWRKQLPEFLTFALNRRITQTMIDAWFAPSNQNHFPADAFLLTCFAIDNFSALNIVVESFHQHVIDDRQAALLELALIAEHRRALDLEEERARAIINKEAG